MVLQSFREELESLIQEQMKKGNNSSHVWALRQIADFMATTSPATLPTSPMGMWGWGRDGLGMLTWSLIEGGGVGKAPKPWETPDFCSLGISKPLGPQKPLGPSGASNALESPNLLDLWAPQNFGGP